MRKGRRKRAEGEEAERAVAGFLHFRRYSYRRCSYRRSTFRLLETWLQLELPDPAFIGSVERPDQVDLAHGKAK